VETVCGFGVNVSSNRQFYLAKTAESQTEKGYARPQNGCVHILSLLIDSRDFSSFASQFQNSQVWLRRLLMEKPMVLNITIRAC